MSESENRVHVCSVSELPEGERVITTVKGREVGVLNVEGEYHALSNVCPHQGGPICEGTVKPVIEGEFEELQKPVRKYYSDTMAVSCPYHGWEYDLETGEHVGNRDIAIPVYEVVTEGGELYIQL